MGRSDHSRRSACSILRIAGLLVAALATVSSLHAQQLRPRPESAATSFYDLHTRTLDDAPASLSRYRGLVSLVVNVASFCGYTPQYSGLETLYRELKGKGFTILGFPSNDFGGQEPGTAQQIAQFCRTDYDVTFPMFEKVVTRGGPGQSPVYAYLGRSGNLPSWNFAKYVIGRDGSVVAFFSSDVTPEDPRLRSAIAKALARAN